MTISHTGVTIKFPNVVEIIDYSAKEVLGKKRGREKERNTVSALSAKERRSEKGVTYINAEAMIAVEISMERTRRPSSRPMTGTKGSRERTGKKENGRPARCVLRGDGRGGDDVRNGIGKNDAREVTLRSWIEQNGRQCCRSLYLAL